MSIGQEIFLVVFIKTCWH